MWGSSPTAPIQLPQMKGDRSKIGQQGVRGAQEFSPRREQARQMHPSEIPIDLRQLPGGKPRLRSTARGLPAGCLLLSHIGQCSSSSRERDNQCYDDCHQRPPRGVIVTKVHDQSARACEQTMIGKLRRAWDGTRWQASDQRFRWVYSGPPVLQAPPAQVTRSHNNSAPELIQDFGRPQ